MPKFNWRLRAPALPLLAAFTLLGGCATIPMPTNPHDPLEPINRAVYSFNETVDGVALKPAAIAYTDVVPPVVRTGVSNFFSNINDVTVAINDVLQGKGTDAASDVGRLAVNSTVGLLGVFDVASKMGLQKRNEDFGLTLGHWGFGPGPFLMLPFFGPSDFRDGLGRIVDYKTDPVTYVSPSHDRNILWGMRVINYRAQLLGASRILQAAALDPYAFLRDAYLQRRRNLIRGGSPPDRSGKGDTHNGKP